MSNLTDQIVNEIDALIDNYGQHLVQGGTGQYLGGPDPFRQEAQSRLTAAVRRYARPGDSYSAELDRIIQLGQSPGWRAAQLLGLLRAVRLDYSAGYLTTVQELIHADLFSDFLAMSEELQAKGYKDAAAVITGSVLEEHLRNVAGRVGVDTTDKDGKPLSAERINEDLGKAAYDTNEQKQVTAWLGLRNSAAHGHYDDYEHARIALMIQGVRDFVSRHKA